ncbi:MAG: hypothetical protein GVY13_10875 [Alphaproteobacteria bacterium]|nr:hypothetical protein [Alphaproteobacteria bacterium]
MKPIESVPTEPDRQTKEAEQDLFEQSGHVGKVIGTGGQARLIVASIFGGIVLIALISLTAVYSSDQRIDDLLSLLEKALLILIGFIVGTSAQGK